MLITAEEHETAQGQIVSLKGRQHPKGSPLKPKASWTTLARDTHLSAGTREPLLHVFPSSVHTARTNATDTKDVGDFFFFFIKKQQIPPLTCDPQLKGGCHACIQRRFKQSLWLHYLPSSSSPLHPSVDTRSHHGEADRPGHHSFIHLPGAFVRWLLAEKGKQINTSPMGLTGNLYLGWNMSGTSLLDSLTVTGQLTGCTDAIPPFPSHWKFILGHKVWLRWHYSNC